VKYSGPSVTIDIRCEQIDNDVYIYIKDNGYGISKKDQEKIFAKFERGKAVERKDAKGFGLGLSYVKRVMEAHLGTVNLFSREGKGTEFVLYLPFRKEK
jgi:two-component system phosphate regulon sensor histidine kinase PhoR